MNAVWSPAQEAVLTAEWALGTASAEIARKVGLTAGAVRRKRIRLGLPARSVEALAAVYAERGAALAALRAPLPASLAPPTLPTLAGSTPRPWVLRMDGECACPVAGFGGELMSCCLPCEGRSSYCLGHRELMHGRPWPPVDPGNVVLFRGKPAARALTG
jgi:hypothetical protein